MRIRSPLLNKLLARLAVLIIRSLFLTVRTEVRFRVPETSCYGEPAGDQRYAYCLWHDGIVLASFGRTPQHCAIVVSQHRDGGLVANALESLGLKPIRGSSSRGGARAARRVIEQTRDLHFTITPDGPRGPRRQVKDGIIYLASRTQHPVVPTYAVATRAWSIKGSWTDMVLPKPFARCVLLAAEPIPIPEGITRETLTRYREQVQREMERLEVIAEHYLQTGAVDYSIQPARSATTRAAA